MSTEPCDLDAIRQRYEPKPPAGYRYQPPADEMFADVLTLLAEVAALREKLAAAERPAYSAMAERLAALERERDEERALTTRIDAGSWEALTADRNRLAATVERAREAIERYGAPVPVGDALNLDAPPVDAGTSEAGTAGSVDAGQADGAVASLAFHRLSAVNRRRCQRWHPGFPADAWTGADWSNAMQGEPCGATPVLSRDAVRALSAHLRIAAQHYVQVPASLLDLARAILAKEGT